MGPLHNTHTINPYALLHCTCFDNNIGQLISCLLFYDVSSDRITKQIHLICLSYFYNTIASWLWVLTSVTGQCPLCFFFCFLPYIFVSKNTRTAISKRPILLHLFAGVDIQYNVHIVIVNCCFNQISSILQIEILEILSVHFI